MWGSKVVTRGRVLPVAGFVLVLLVSACGGSSSKSTAPSNGTTSSPSNNSTGASTSTTSGAAASPHVDLTVSGALTFHLTGTKADCGANGVNLTAVDYPEVGNNLNIATINGGASFKWFFDNTTIYANTAQTTGTTVTTDPFKIVLKGTKLVAAVAVGTPAKPGVTLNGTITCPG